MSHLLIVKRLELYMDLAIYKKKLLLLYVFVPCRRIVLSHRKNTPHPFALSVFEDRVYFTEWTRMGVFSVSKYAGEDSVVEVNKNTEKKAIDVAVIHPLRQTTCRHSKKFIPFFPMQYKISGLFTTA